MKTKKLGIIILSGVIALSPVITPLAANAATTSNVSTATTSASSPIVINMNNVSNGYVTVNGSITKGGTTIYTFTAPATGNYTFQLLDSTFNANGRFDDNTTGGSYQANDQSGNGFKFSHSANAGDQCTVKIWGVSTSTSGTFGLKIGVPN